MIPRLSLVVILILFALSGCITLPDPEASQDRANDVVARLTDKEEILTQSFVSRRPRLDGITLWIGSGSQEGDPALSTAFISLFREDEPETPFSSTLLSIQGSGQHTVHFPPAGARAGQRFFLEIRPDTGQLEIRGVNTDVYPLGEAVIGNVTADADIAFRLTYDYDFLAALTDAWGMIKVLWLAFPFFALLIAPGFLLLDLTGLRSRFDQGEQLGISVGLSAAAIPILMLWTSNFNLPWSSLFVRLIFGGLGLFALWRILSSIVHGRHIRFQPAFLWLLIVCLFALGLRFAMVRDLSAPAWVDSVHHAFITRLIVETGGFPTTYQPYFDISPTEYHAGYHAGLAAFQWFTGLDLLSGMLIYGQVLNVLAVAVVYLLTTTLTKNRTAGVLSAAIAGLFTPMPAYYTSWGRYSQLAGLLLLPAALALVVGFIKWKLGSSRKTAIARRQLHYRGITRQYKYQGAQSHPSDTHRKEVARLPEDLRPNTSMRPTLKSESGACSAHREDDTGLSDDLRPNPSRRWIKKFESSACDAHREEDSRLSEVLKPNPFVRRTLTSVHSYYRRSLKRATETIHPWRLLLLITIVFAGLLLVHYRVVVFMGVLLLAYLASQLNLRRMVNLQLVRQFGLGVILPAAGAILLTLPWTLPNYLDLFLPGLSSTSGSPVRLFADFSWSYLTPALGLYTLYAAALGLALAFWKGRRFAITLVLWTQGMFLFANLGALGLPLSNIVNNTSVQITLFMPIGLLGGYLIAEITRFVLGVIPVRWKFPVSTTLTLAAAGLSIFGASKILPIINYNTLLFRSADRPALAWIEANIPQEETILIDPFLWGYGIYAGNDGGYWIEPLTGRKSLPPPVLFGFSEPEVVSRIIDLSRQTHESAGNPEALYAFMQSVGIEFVYAGVRGGRFSPAVLMESDRFEMVYGDSGAFVFRTRE